MASMNHLVGVGITSEVHNDDKKRRTNQVSSSAQSRKAIKMISRREGIWDRDGDEEEEAEVMAYQLLVGSLLVRDGGVGANDESKQGRVRRHPLT